MNLKIYDRACKYIDKMLFSRRDNWCEKRLYIKPDTYLQIEIERVQAEDITNGAYDGWERGTPIYMKLYVTDKSGRKLNSRIVQYCYEREYKTDLDRLLDQYL